MFLIDNDVIVTSASDLTTASACEFGFLRRLDALRRRVPMLTEPPDALLDRTARLGDAHEARVLERHRAQLGSAVVEFDRPAQLSRQTLTRLTDDSLAALTGKSPVVFQATMFEVDEGGHGFVGFADFLTLQESGAYRVEDTKLARHEKVTAVLQLAAYADFLTRQGITVDSDTSLLLGNGKTSVHRVADLLPTYSVRRGRLLDLVTLRDHEGAAGDPVGWGDRRFSICGTCIHCTTEIAAHDDVLQVAGLRRMQRERLMSAGIRSAAEFAASTGSVSGIGDRTLSSLRQQAQLQLSAVAGSAPPFTVFDTAPITALPAPDDGDIFFDFEGDPLHTEGEGAEWGLDYLFGLVEADGTFKAFWAHDFAEEGQALRDFLSYLTARRAQYPGMHVYHYASYERTHLAQLAIRHGFGEDIVDGLFRSHVLVDLYPVVRGSVRVGSPSYSIKKLEPLYMGDDLRDDDGVTNAGDSIVKYAKAVEQRERGEIEAYEETLKSIEDYNAYDCRSTLRLRDWLRGFAHGEGSSTGVGTAPQLSDVALAAIALEQRFEPLIGDPLAARLNPERMALALTSAAIQYHAREDKQTYWEHFARLLQPVDEWIDTRGVFDIDEVEVVRDWYKEGRQRVLRRELRLTGRVAPGSKFEAAMHGTNARLIYEPDADVIAPEQGDPGARIARDVSITSVFEEALEVTEALKNGETRTYEGFPIALTPGGPLQTPQQRAAIREFAERVLADFPQPVNATAMDILRRTSPRLTAPLPRPDTLEPESLAAAIQLLDRSYLAIQGPPGTGKTYVGSGAVAELVRRGWKVGIVAQSHAIIANFLIGARGAGAPIDDIAHVSSDPAEFQVTSAQIGQWATQKPGGYLIGATAWAFSNPSQIARGQLDLLVIDEAGQYSLANTIAVSASARNLLLLGDPQQLPQVSQGTHPQPVDESALGWLAGREYVLAERFGYFLPQTRRMSAELTESVSNLSYAGALGAHACTGARHLDGVKPGLTALKVPHSGNSLSSTEEADAVVGIVRSLIGNAWTDPDKGRAADPLRPEDVIVVAPYNAHRTLVEQKLRDARLAGVRVGTVDKFQGQEAVIAILTLSASSAAEVPRGLDFLLNRNRLNVGISRAQWASWIIYSPGLLEHLPATVPALKEFSAFVHLVGADSV